MFKHTQNYFYCELLRFDHNVQRLQRQSIPVYLRVPSKRVAMVSRKVFWGASRPFITGILTQMWDCQQLAGGHTIPEAH